MFSFKDTSDTNFLTSSLESLSLLLSIFALTYPITTSWINYVKGTDEVELWSIMLGDRIKSRKVKIVNLQYISISDYDLLDNISANFLNPL